jgi:hypothetical protein
VYKYDYGTGASPFTVFTAKGKLMKHTKKSMLLGAIKGIPLQYSEFSGSTNTNYQVSWDGIDFVKTAYMPQCNNGNCMWKDILTKETISFGNLQMGELNLWSQSLGGQVRVPLTGCNQTFPNNCQPGSFCQPKTTCTPPTDALNIVFFAEDLVYPSDTIPATLECYDNCPNAPTAAGVDLNLNNGYVYGMMSGPSKTAVDYSFDSAGMNLILAGNPVILPSIPAGSQNQWGVNSGPLFDLTPANITKLRCDYPDQNQVFGTCGWKAWSVLDVFYTWQTGPDNWNQFTALKDGAAFLTFEPPLQVKYVHHKAPFDGSTFMMDYSGFGQLNGIPGKCVNMDTGLNVDCGTSNGDNTVRWVPAFVISPKQADGSLTSVEAGGITYYVKPLEMEQRMKQADLAACSSALTLTHFTLPDISIWVDPAISTEPTVTTAPKVIGGLVQ